VSLLQPLSAGEAEEMASRIGDPATHEHCTAAGPDVQVCVPAPYSSLGDRFAREVRPVAEALPPGWTAEPVTFRLLFDGNPADLPAAVRDRLPEGVPSGEDVLYLGHTSHPESRAAGRFRLAATAMGLATVPDEHVNVVAGQARGAVVAWLAVHDLADARGRIAPYDGDHDPVNKGDIWPGLCHKETGVVVWAPQDLEAARAMLELPDDEVRRVIHDDWDRWLDRSTSTDELLAALDLPPVGSPDRVDLANLDSCG
jgi:hypothetical protein